MSEAKDKIYELVAEQLGVGTAELNDNAGIVSELGADSLDIIELVMALEEEFDIEIDDDDFDKLRTVGDIVEFIGSKHR